MPNGVKLLLAWTGNYFYVISFFLNFIKGYEHQGHKEDSISVTSILMRINNI